MYQEIDYFFNPNRVITDIIGSWTDFKIIFTFNSNNIVYEENNFIGEIKFYELFGEKPVRNYKISNYEFINYENILISNFECTKKYSIEFINKLNIQLKYDFQTINLKRCYPFMEELQCFDIHSISEDGTTVSKKFTFLILNETLFTKNLFRIFKKKEEELNNKENNYDTILYHFFPIQRIMLSIHLYIFQELLDENSEFYLEKEMKISNLGYYSHISIVTNPIQDLTDNSNDDVSNFNVKQYEDDAFYGAFEGDIEAWNAHFL